MGKKHFLKRISNRIHLVLEKIPFLKKPVWNILARVLLTSIGMVLLMLLVYFNSVPNPNMILITGLVLFCCVFGWPAGVASVIAMIIYSMFFFSTDHSFFTFTSDNLVKVIISSVGSALSAMLICLFRRSAKREEELLVDSNAKLEKKVLYDPLTGAKNRGGFKKDFGTLSGKDVFLLVMDIDDFKTINDVHGHLMGDKSLVCLSRDAMKVFGEGNVYRIGGDEFVVLWQGNDKQTFESKLIELQHLSDSSAHIPVRFSAGYVQAHIDESTDDYELIRMADESLYEAKKDGKNGFKGTLLR